MPEPRRDWVAAAVARSSTPAERRTSAFVPAPPSPAHAERADARLQRWSDRVAQGDPARFERLLRWDGIADGDAARRAVGDVLPADGVPLPEWTALVDAATTTAADTADSARDRALDVARPLPFEDALVPFVAAARAHVGRARAAAGEGWTPAADAAFERVLLEQLAALAASTLHATFAAFRAVRPPRLGVSLAGGPSRAVYLTFVHHLVHDGGWVELFGRYPVLARLIGTRATAWADAHAELGERLARDRARLAAAFNGGAPLGPVTGAAAGLSDPHRGGRSVCVLTFAGGTRVVYKPRDPGAERAFADIVAWFNARLGDTLADAASPTDVGLRAPRTVAGADGRCGWCEFVAAAPCADAAAVARYYRRAGALLALAHVLGAADLHSGNVIAAGDHPVLVDLEVIAAGLVRGGGDATGPRRGGEHRWRYWNSVLRTGLLPGRGVASGGKTYLEGGFAGAQAEHPVRARRWRHVNTDAMAPYTERTVVRSASGPTVAPDAPEGVSGDLMAHRHEVVRGLRAGLVTLAAHRTELAAGPLTALLGCRTRAVLRDTRVYDALLARASHPHFLTDGVEWAAELDVLRGPELRGAGRPRLWDAWAGEQRALAGLDVPLFETTPAMATLRAERCADGGGRDIPDVFEEPGYDAVLARLAALDADEITRQLEFVRIALSAPDLGETRSAHARASGAPSADADHPLDPATAVDEAAALGTVLRALATPGTDGTTWVGIVEKPGATRSELRDVGFDLYSGRLGIAVFFAALASVTGADDARALALDAVGPFAGRGPRDARRADALLEALDIGGATGVGGVVYGLTVCGRLLRAPALLDAAGRAAAALTPARVARDPQFDVMSGAAGAALGLLALHRAAPDPALVLRADACARRLRAGHVDAYGGMAWAAPDGRLLTGFGHGAAGVAHALRGVAAALGTDGGARGYAHAAVRADAFVDAHFDEGTANWFEEPGAARDRGTDRMWCSWCHGAAGVGLGRLSAGEAGRAMVSAALATSAASDFPAADHLCCGTLGRAEALCTAGVAWGRDDLVAEARRKAAGVVARARVRGAYVTGFAPEYAPAFFQGLAGVGYELLRLARPAALPSVLRWE